MIAALIPAAGKSERMGRPKLTLPIAGEPLIARVIHALFNGGAGRVLVVSPPIDALGAAALVTASRAAGAEVFVLDQATPDMRTTIERGLDQLGRVDPPRWLALTPGDLPGLTAELVRRVFEQARATPEALVVPQDRQTGRRGHPLVVPWPLACEIPALPAGLGVNALVQSHASRLVPLMVDEPRAFDDWDRPEDLSHWPAVETPVSSKEPSP